MDTRQERAEPERREGFGGRVRRFIDNELSRALDKDDPAPDAAAPPAPIAEPGPVETAPVETAPVETAPVETAPVETAPVETASAETIAEPAPAETVGRQSEREAADGSAQRIGLLNDPAGLRDQWQQVQGTFVDDPQQAVHQAGMLVERTLQEIHDNVTRGQISDPTSTEDLRVSFQRYREFFQRLLSA